MMFSEKLEIFIKDVKSELTSHGFMMIIIGVIINVLLSSAITYFRIPLWLDSAGTIIVAVLSGPWTSFITGLLTFIIFGLSNLSVLPFFLIGSVLGVIIGYLHRLRVLTTESGLLELLGLCMLSSIISTMVYSPIISITLWTGSDYLRLLYELFFGADNTLSPGLFNSLVGVELLAQLLDKTVIIFLVYLIIQFVPEKYFKNERRKKEEPIIKKRSVKKPVIKRVKKEKVEREIIIEG